MVCRQVKSLYGLKQAARVWNEQLDVFLYDCGFTRSNAEPCLYIKQEEGKIVYIIIYVDDLLIAGRNEEEIQLIADKLNKHFQLSDLGVLKHYLGIQIEKEKDVFHINQEKYIEKILNDVGMQDAKTSKFPLDPGYLNSRTEETMMSDSKQYQRLIGALLYIAVNTRPDIMTSVTILSQFNKQPSRTNWTEAKRVLRYLKDTKSKRL